MHFHDHSHAHHDHHHGHSHGHGHSGAHGRMRLAFWLNLIFALIELIGGVWINSFAVTSNAIHDLGDSLALALSLSLEKKSVKKSDAQYSYGYRRFSLASAFLTSVFLVSGSCLVLFFGLKQIFEPHVPKVSGMIGFAILGLFVNGYSLWTLRKGSSMNEKVLSWHFVEDTLSWTLVLVAGGIIHATEWAYADVGLGMLLALWIIWNVQKNLLELMRIFLQAAPRGLSLAQIESALRESANVQGVHHLHLWTIDGEQHVLTAHIVLQKGKDLSLIPSLKSELKMLLKERFKISEATFEFELDSEYCGDPVHP